MIVTEEQNRLTIRVPVGLLAWIFGTVGVLLAAWTVAEFAFDLRDADHRRTLIISTLTMLLPLFIMYEVAHFEFDRGNGLITWSRKRAWGTKRGTLSFSQVKDVVDQRPIGDTGTPSRRVALLTPEGEVPISVAFNGDPMDDCPRIAAQIRKFLGTKELSVEERVRLMVASGKTIDAVKILSEQRGLSLGDAKREIDTIRKSLKPGGG